MDSINRKNGLIYGDIPDPVKSQYTFLGWYTLKNCLGTKIKMTDVITTDKDYTIYAGWKKNEEYDILKIFNELSPQERVYKKGIKISDFALMYYATGMNGFESNYKNELFDNVLTFKKDGIVNFSGKLYNFLFTDENKHYQLTDRITGIQLCLVIYECQQPKKRYKLLYYDITEFNKIFDFSIKVHKTDELKLFYKAIDKSGFNFCSSCSYRRYYLADNYKLLFIPD